MIRRRLLSGVFLFAAILTLAGHVASAVEAKHIEGIEAYRQSYILFDSYNDHYNFNSIYGPALGSQYLQQEVKFQISFQGLMYDFDAWGRKFEIGAAYTQQAYWQLFNKPMSAPFRETNYEPELFVRWQDKQWMGQNTHFRFGYDHQSNGRSNPYSRSWNRLYGEVKLQDPDDDMWVGALRGWWRIPEKAGADDNPGITEFYGFWQFDGRLALDHEKKWKLHLMGRDNLRAKNKGAVQLDLSWKPDFFHDFSFYVQGFYGYGENLIAYNYVAARFGAGILLTNW